MLRLAERVMGRFPLVGLAPCPHGANASSPLFGRSQRDWRTAVDRWVRRPEESKHLILASTAIDSRALTTPELGQTIRAATVAAAQDAPFVRAMTRFALAERPPFGFVRNSMVGRLGEKRKSLDLKSAGLAPIVALARAFSVRAGNTTGGTLQRLDTASAAGLLDHEEAETLKSAFELYHSVLTEERVDALRHGVTPQTVIEPAHIDPLRRRYLRDGFRATNKIQDRLAEDLRNNRL